MKTSAQMVTDGYVVTTLTRPKRQRFKTDRISTADLELDLVWTEEWKFVDSVGSLTGTEVTW